MRRRSEAKSWTLLSPIPAILDVEKIIKIFDPLSTMVHGKPLVNLDNAGNFTKPLSDQCMEALYPREQQYPRGVPSSAARTEAYEVRAWERGQIHQGSSWPQCVVSPRALRRTTWWRHYEINLFKEDAPIIISSDGDTSPINYCSLADSLRNRKANLKSDFPSMRKGHYWWMITKLLDDHR